MLRTTAVVSVPTIPAISRGPDDDQFLATAHAAGATYLVSADNDLLDLVEHEGIAIMNCVEFANLLEA